MKKGMKMMVYAVAAVVTMVACRSRLNEGESDVRGGVTSGNGGFVILCEKAYPLLNNNKVAVVDFSEAIRRKFPVDLGGKNLSYKAKVQLVLDRIKNVEPNDYKDFTDLIAKLDPVGGTDAALEEHMHLGQVESEANIKLPGPDCTATPAVVRLPAVIADQKTFTFRKEIWDQLDDDNKAVLLVHEAVYAKYFNDSRADMIRHFVGHLISKDMLPTNRWRYLESVMNLVAFQRDLKHKFFSTDLDDLGMYAVHVEKTNFLPDNEVEVYVYGGFTFQYGLNKGTKVPTIHAGIFVHLTADNKVKKITTSRWRLIDGSPRFKNKTGQLVDCRTIGYDSASEEQKRMDLKLYYDFDINGALIDCYDDLHAPPAGKP